MVHDEMICGELVRVKGNFPEKMVYLGQSHYEPDLFRLISTLRMDDVGKHRERDEMLVPKSSLSRFVHPYGYKPANGRAYQAMLEASVHAGWPTNYHHDLTFHDALVLGHCAYASKFHEIGDGDSFGWILRELGTDMVRADAYIHDTAASYHLKNGPERNRYFWWDGSSLRELPSIHTLIDLHNAVNGR
jgi:hypothetical protein